MRPNRTMWDSIQNTYPVILLGIVPHPTDRQLYKKIMTREVAFVDSSDLLAIIRYSKEHVDRVLLDEDVCPDRILSFVQRNPQLGAGQTFTVEWKKFESDWLNEDLDRAWAELCARFEQMHLM